MMKWLTGIADWQDNYFLNMIELQVTHTLGKVTTSLNETKPQEYQPS